MRSIHQAINSRQRGSHLTLSTVLIAVCIGIVIVLSVNQSFTWSDIKKSSYTARVGTFKGLYVSSEQLFEPAVNQHHRHENSVKQIDNPTPSPITNTPSNPTAQPNKQSDEEPAALPNNQTPEPSKQSDNQAPAQHSDTDDSKQPTEPVADQPTNQPTDQPAKQSTNQHSHDDDDDDEITTEQVFDAAHNHTHSVEKITERQKKARETREQVRVAMTKECNQMIEKYHIVIGLSWGDIANNETMKDIWKEKECDTWLALENYPNYLKQHPELLLPITVDPKRSPPPPPDTQDLPSIAICVCTTTRGVTVNQLTDLSLFASLLPSIYNTTEPGFEYWIYVLYDVGDTFYDNDEHLAEIRDWVTRTVTGPLYEKRGIHSRLVLEPFENTLKKPGPAFNYLTHLAYIDGAKYIYRINDDTSFATEWAKPMVDRIEALGSPYGVIGPLCREGNVHILTHDFVHRLHHEIFETFHYPASLSDWWMDDWVSRVYGKQRTILMNDVIVKHAIKSHGTRYAVDFSHAPLLGAEVEFGRQKIETWMVKQIEKGGNCTQQLDDFRHDEFHFHF